MTDVVLGLLETIVATFVPLSVGISIPFIWRKSGAQLQACLLAVASGIMLWFFLDTMNDAALLGIDSGFTGGAPHLLLVSLFGIGLAVWVYLERWYSRPSSESGFPIQFTYVVAAIVAVGMGMHAIGEGIAIGSILPRSSSILDAVGGIYPATAYVLHKILEGFVVGVFALVSVRGAKRVAPLLLFIGLPTFLGALAGLPGTLDATYFFAFGGSIFVFVEYKLIPKVFQILPLRRAILFSAVGLYLFYLAGLFHGSFA